MAQPNIVEQCLVILTEIVNRQAQPPSLRSRIEKELRYLPSFEGKPGTLPAFITSVNRALTEYGDQAPQAYTVIYNEKILGSAKNYLETSPPATWEECQAKLKLQYKPTKDQGHIMREINTLKVSSIIELMDKISILVSDIAECAIFSEYQNHIVNNLSSVLVLKIKEITAGALAAELYNKFSLGEIRPIINKYIGQDQYNLKLYKSNQVIKQNIPGRSHQNNFRPNNNYNNYSGQFRRNNFNNNSGQFRQNNFNNSNSGHYRRNFHNNNGSRQFGYNRNNNNNQVQPMEVDTISTKNEVNQLGETEFFIN